MHDPRECRSQPEVNAYTSTGGRAAGAAAPSA